MKYECIQLATFSKTAFPEQFQTISDLLSKIQIEINNLSLVNNVTGQGKCTVCNGELQTVNTHVKEFPTMTLCKNCPEKITALLNQLEGPTETMWI
jgi:hypothetical protein